MRRLLSSTLILAASLGPIARAGEPGPASVLLPCTSRRNPSRPRTAGTGPSSRRPAPRSRRSTSGPGSATRSTPSSWPSSRRTGCPTPPRPTAPTLLRRLTFDLIGCRRRPRRSTRSSPTRRPTPTRGWSTACWPARTTASGGRSTGSTWPATPRPTASSSTRPGPTPGATATGSSRRSTTTCPTTSSSAGSSPATSSRPTTPRRSSPPASTAAIPTWST